MQRDYFSEKSLSGPSPSSLLPGSSPGSTRHQPLVLSSWVALLPPLLSQLLSPRQALLSKGLAMPRDIPFTSRAWAQHRAKVTLHSTRHVSQRRDGCAERENEHTGHFGGCSTSSESSGETLKSLRTNLAKSGWTVGLAKQWTVAHECECGGQSGV